MLADIEAGLIGAVVVWDLDRLHRRPVELESFMDLADRKKVPLASVGGDIDLATRQGRMVARIKGAVAAQEADAVSDRVKRAQQQRREQGRPGNGGVRPFGYERDRMTVREEEAEIVREVADRILQGDSLVGIGRDLNRRGVTTSGGTPWESSKLRETMLRARLAGLLQHRGEIIGEGAWVPILDRARWEKVQSILTDPERKRYAKGNQRKWLLSGFAVCGACGGRMAVHYGGPSKAGKTRSYACKVCMRVRRNMAKLDAYATDALFERLQTHPVEVDRYEDSEAVTLRDQIEALERRLRQIAVEFADDLDVTPEMLRAMTRRVREKLDGLRALQVDDHRAELVGTLVQFDAAEAWATFSVEHRRQWFEFFAERILVRPSKVRGRGFDAESIEIVWKDPKSLRFRAQPDT